MNIYVEGNFINLKFPYNPAKIAMVKSLPDYRWLPSKKIWRYPISTWTAMALIELFPKAEFDDLTRELAKKGKWLEKKSTTKKGPKMGKLYPFQSSAVKFIEARNGMAILGDEMGLGKTVEFLWYARRAKLERILVPCPATVMYKWANEVKRWTKYEPTVIPTGKTPIPKSGVVIMSYAMMTKRLDELLEIPWDLIGFDEFHYLKGRKGRVKRVDAAFALITLAPRVILMSGTPFLNRPKELFNGLQMMNPNEWTSFYRFGLRYCGGQMQNFNGSTNREELNSRIKHYMIRRTKGEVLTQLPPLTRTKVPLELDNMKDYREVADEVFQAIKDLDRSHKGYYINALDRLNLLRRFVGKSKARAVVSWIENFLDNTDRKLVVYCHHKENIKYLKEKLNDFRPVSITGDDPSKVRTERIERFQRDPEFRVCLITSAGGEGIDLFGTGGIDSSTILFVERDWTPTREEQAEARLHRIGQVNAVEAIYPVAEGTIDVKIDTLIDKKRAIIHDIVGLDDITTSIIPDLLEDL